MRRELQCSGDRACASTPATAGPCYRAERHQPFGRRPGGRRRGADEHLLSGPAIDQENEP
jgi:hypothetical protein